MREYVDEQQKSRAYWLVTARLGSALQPVTADDRHNELLAASTSGFDVGYRDIAD